MKKIAVNLIVLIFLSGFAGNNFAYLQLGNLNKLKNKTSKLKKKKKDNSSSSKTLSVNACSKYMNEGYKYKDGKKYPEALTAFNNALKENPGDYSAKNQVQQTESEVKTIEFAGQTVFGDYDTYKVTGTFNNEKYKNGEFCLKVAFH